ncbi:hypothetical protein D3C78_1199880 [compost metagenome]
MRITDSSRLWASLTSCTANGYRWTSVQVRNSQLMPSTGLANNRVPLGNTLRVLSASGSGSKRTMVMLGRGRR